MIRIEPAIEAKSGDDSSKVYDFQTGCRSTEVVSDWFLEQCGLSCSHGAEHMIPISGSRRRNDNGLVAILVHDRLDGSGVIEGTPARPKDTRLRLIDVGRQTLPTENAGIGRSHPIVTSLPAGDRPARNVNAKKDTTVKRMVSVWSRVKVVEKGL